MTLDEAIDKCVKNGEFEIADYLRELKQRRADSKLFYESTHYDDYEGD